ncbi:aKG-HExxH-type peptide beta-hydroxylase [Streptomyces hoynatensis]|uniref:HEXXH motif domain-containing protein n=1 Tax=Streptomyces hoynatensis TaxID=1141874 RepID=A0A3A9YWZ5_9ACTN|nr:HEXXH motif-containing putative peptide modification protein [Streptomyces hoynatensis]RKN40455.1 HEXXH motif domain-containing protein [Streptomyces hoynatensis]
MNATLAPERVRELGRAEGDPETLAALTAGQHTRRMLLLRVLLDALDAAGTPRDPAAALAAEHADLLQEVEQTAPETARQVLFYSLTGPWAERCVQGLDGGHPAQGERAGEEAAWDVRRDIAHLGSLAAAAAARSGLGFRTRLTVHDGRVHLPTLGALRCAAPEGHGVELAGEPGRLRIRPAGLAATEVHLDEAGSWRSADPGWLPLHTLDGGPRLVLLDDLDPSRFVHRAGAAEQAGPGALRPEERAQWERLWREALPLLSLGGPARSAELALLDCLVPIPHAAAADGASHYSGTSARAFGAVVASPPPSPAHLAAGLAHELQHAKLSALGDLMPLHTAGPECRHWAPWRPDPRPFDGLLQGTYAHLALAAFWQHLALALDDPAERDHAWAAHARTHAQVAAVLPVLRGARRLTDAGRLFVQAIAERHEELRQAPPPAGHAVRAAAYVETARTLWLRRHGR